MSLTESNLDESFDSLNVEIKPTALISTSHSPSDYEKLLIQLVRKMNRAIKSKSEELKRQKIGFE
jgi:hypothetical protein